MLELNCIYLNTEIHCLTFITLWFLVKKPNTSWEAHAMAREAVLKP